jgi:Flp pilus assembly protein CpaB
VHAVVVKASAEEPENSSIRDNSRVDVLVTIKQGEKAGKKRIVLRNVQVLSVPASLWKLPLVILPGDPEPDSGASNNPDPTGGKFTSVTLAITPEQATTLALAEQLGTLTVAVCAPRKPMKLPPGTRATGIYVPQDLWHESLLPGDRVNVLGTPDPVRGGPDAKLLRLQDMLVLKFTPAEECRRYYPPILTLAATFEQATRFNLAASIGYTFAVEEHLPPKEK